MDKNIPDTDKLLSALKEFTENNGEDSGCAVFAFIIGKKDTSFIMNGKESILIKNLINCWEKYNEAQQALLRDLALVIISLGNKNSLTLPALEEVLTMLAHMAGLNALDPSDN